MKGRRRNIVLLGVILIGVLPLWALLFQSHINHIDMRSLQSFVSVPKSGEVLDCAALAKNESVLIERLFMGCEPGSSYATRFLISGDNEWMTVWDCTLQWNAGREPTAESPKIRQAYPTNPADRLGLENMLKVFRLRPPNGSTAVVTYRIEYRRAGNTVGEERFVLPPDFMFSGANFASDDYLKWFLDRYGVPPQLLAQVMSPDMITEKEANPESCNHASAAKP